MKPKELSDLTGLKERTIRFYVEQGLLAPTIEQRNGRKYREYSESDAETLKIIASLRRAWFTLDEIRRMQEDPEMIQEILPQYIEWLHAQQQTLQGLVAVADSLQVETIETIEQLHQMLSNASKDLPLPKLDIKPHFEYLDMLDVRPKVLPPDEQMLVFDNKPVLWPYLKSSSRKWAEETSVAAREHDTSVRDREPGRDPVWLAIIKGILMATSVSLGIICLINLFMWNFPLKLWAIFLMVAASRGGLEYIKYRKERQAWLGRIEKDKKEEK